MLAQNRTAVIKFSCLAMLSKNCNGSRPPLSMRQ